MAQVHSFLMDGLKQVSILEYLKGCNDLASKLSFIIIDSFNYIFKIYIIQLRPLKSYKWGETW